MSIIAFVATIFAPLLQVIDEWTVSPEEKQFFTNEANEIKNRLAEEMLKYEDTLNKLRAQSIQAEAMGQSWLQRTWRPITMLTFLALITLDSLTNMVVLHPEIITMMNIGLGGYVVGRSAEKIVDRIKR